MDLGPVVGPCGVGISFGLPTVLAQCAKNAVNALAKRHLTAPLNKGRVGYRNVFLTTLKHRLRTFYQASIINQLDGEWRVGKPKAKLHLIDESRKLHWVKHHEAESFGKLEVTADIPSKSRLIQGNKNEVTAYEFPEEYAAISKALQMLSLERFEDSGIDFQFVYAGGLNHDELSDMYTEWMAEPGKKFIDERDGKSWDATMQESLLISELRIYEMLGMRAAEAFYERCQGVRGRIRVKIHAIYRLVIRYVTAWKRLSGDWNTSVGNTIISMIISFVVLTELPEHLRPERVRAFFMGDDYLGVYTYKQLPPPADLHSALNAGESAMGITPERAIFEDPLAPTFISLGVWPRENGQFQFVPHPGKQLRKLFWSVKRLHPNVIPDYQTAISIAFWPVYWGFPLMMQFLKLHYTKPNTKYKFDAYYADKLTKRVRNVNWQAGLVYKYRLPYTATHLQIPTHSGVQVLHSMVAEEMLRQELLDPCQRVAALTR